MHTDSASTATVQSVMTPALVIEGNHRPGAGAWLQVLAALLWLPQAGLLAMAVQRMAEGRGNVSQIWPLAVAVLALGLLRA